MKLNLIVILITLVANWLQETQIHLDFENKFEKWVVKHIYDDIKINKLTVKLFRSDWKLLKQQQFIVNDFDDFQHTFEQSHIIVIIIRELYNNHIKQIMKNIHYLQKLSKSRKISQSVHMYWNIVWDRVVVNETHFEMTLTFKTIQLFKNISVTQKWFLMSIFFEWLFTQITNWIKILKTRN